MRNKYDNIIDNFSNRLDNKIQRRIDKSNYSFYNSSERDVTRIRDGLLESGAFQLKNTDSTDYAMFGFTSSYIVGK